MEVDTNSVLKEKSEYLVDDIRSALRKKKIKYSNLGSKLSGAVVTITDKKNLDLARKSIRENIEKGILINSDGNKLNLSFSDEFIIDSNIKTVDQSIEVVRKELMNLEQKNQLFKNKETKELLFSSLA